MKFVYFFIDVLLVIRVKVLFYFKFNFMKMGSFKENVSIILDKIYCCEVEKCM